MRKINETVLKHCKSVIMPWKLIFHFLFFFPKSLCTTAFRFLRITSGFSLQLSHFGYVSVELPREREVPFVPQWSYDDLNLPFHPLLSKSLKLLCGNIANIGLWFTSDTKSVKGGSNINTTIQTNLSMTDKIADLYTSSI